jgi:Fe-S-cluster containining protein
VKESKLGRGTPLANTYRELLERLDEWFSASAERNPGIIPCRPGCSNCCNGPFDISVADALMVREAFNRLPESERDAVLEGARKQVLRMKQLEPGWDMRLGLEGISEAGFDRLAETLGDEPCPLLDQAGSCRIYADRPLICRMIGLGVITPGGRTIDNTCPILGDFPVYATLPPQYFDLESLEELERACLEAASLEMLGTMEHAGFETTISLALTQDQ